VNDVMISDVHGQLDTHLQIQQLLRLASRSRAGAAEDGTRALNESKCALAFGPSGLVDGGVKWRISGGRRYAHNIEPARTGSEY
jgi:hypothetical protein